MNIIRSKRKTLQKNKLIEPIINALIPLIAEDPSDDFEDEDEDNVARMAAQTLDCMSINLPPEQVMPPTLRNIESLIKSPQPQARKAAMVALAVPFPFECLFSSHHAIPSPRLLLKEHQCISVGISQLSLILYPSSWLESYETKICKIFLLFFLSALQV